MTAPPRVTITLPSYSIETEKESEGRWIAEVPEVPGVLVYGTSEEDARAKVQALLLRVLADRVEKGETP